VITDGTAFPETIVVVVVAYQGYGHIPRPSDSMTTSGYAGHRRSSGYDQDLSTTSGYTARRRSAGYDSNLSRTSEYTGRRRTGGYR
jgi:hypothetical protein